SNGSDDPAEPTGQPQAEEAKPGGEDGQKSDDSDASGDDKAPDDALLKAADTALTKIGDGAVVEIESEDGGAYWEIEVAASSGQIQKLDVSADGSSIERGPKKAQQNDRSRSRVAKRVKAASLDHADAYQAVLDARDGDVVELELDNNDGV